MIKKYNVILLVGGIAIFILFACKQQSVTENLPDYKAIGDSITQLTFDTLSRTLQREMTKNGPASAIGFCNEQALTITAAFAAEDISIKRTALKYRNPGNAPDEEETTILLEMLERITRGDTLKPFIRTILQDSTVHYYKPIILMPLCLSCHGTPGEHIANNTLEALKNSYPGDSAINFAAGDLRGMWHVKFKKS